MAEPQQAQFDGVNPVSGYTLFHGKDGKSYYLKGDNLSDDEVTARVKTLRSQQAGPPLTEQEAATGARANALARQNLQEAATAPYEQEQAELQRRKNLAMNLQNKNIAPFTSASMAYFPAASARMLLGSKLGSDVGAYAGRKIGGSPEAEQYGELAGGALGGLASGFVNRNSVASALRKPATSGQSQLGLPGTVKEILPPSLQRWTIPSWMIPKGELGTPTNPGPFSKIPTRLPASLSSDPFSPAVEQVQPSPFAGATSSAGPLMRGASGPSVAPESVAFGGSTPRVAAPTEASVSVYPEPRTPLAEDRPGAAWSIPREELPAAAQRGQPGAVETMRNLGRPIILTPRGAVGTTNPEFMAVRQAAYDPFSPTSEQVNASPFAPQLRQEVNEMAVPSAASRVPEWQAGQVDMEIARLKNILRDPRATAEEQSIAQSQLRNLTEQPPHRFSNSAKTRQQIKDLASGNQ